MDPTPETEPPELDVSALLASINSNLEEGLQQGSQQELPAASRDSPLKPGAQGRSPDPPASPGERKEPEPGPGRSPGEPGAKSNVFTIVREKAEVVEELDPLLRTLEKIKIVAH